MQDCLVRSGSPRRLSRLWRSLRLALLVALFAAPATAAPQTAKPARPHSYAAPEGTSPQDGTSGRDYGRAGRTHL